MVDMDPLPIDSHFDETFANQIARLEAYNKHHYRPNSYLHKWWARRCGTTFRLILKHLVEEPGLRDFYAPGGLESKLILDPMMGGGTTLHEAIRMGATVLGADLDPIPVLQARATLTQVPLVELEEAFAALFTRLSTDLNPYFQTVHPQTGLPGPFWYVLYGLRRHCKCQEVVVVDSLTLRQKSDGSTVHLCPKTWQIINGQKRGDQAVGTRPLIIEKSLKRCQNCAKLFKDYLDEPFYARYVPLAVVGHDQNQGLFIKAVDEADLARLIEVEALRQSLPFERELFEVAQGRKTIQLHQRGVTNYLDLFSSRQLLYLDSAIKHLPALAENVRLNLGLLISTSLEFNAMLCGYKGKGRRRAGAIRHVFAHHAYAFPYTAVENNPLYPRKSSGTLQKLFHARIRNGRLWAMRPQERLLESKATSFQPIPGEKDSGLEINHLSNPILAEGHPQKFWLYHGSATDLPIPNECVDAIVTDPPYFDSVQYSDLSAFFRVWLAGFLPKMADWQVDLRQSAVDPHKLDRESRYRELMTAIFKECYRVINKDHGRLIFTFHHWNPKAWIALTAALKAANFRLINRYVVFSENPISVHINNMKSLLHDVVLVLAPGQQSYENKWQRPLQVNLNDSEKFCRDCGSLLGYTLAVSLSYDELVQIWQEELQGE